MAVEKISPGMQQYLDIKKNHPDAFLLFRMGDFYELFYDDAVEAAQILELTLTSRNRNAENPIPMAGVPYHSAQQYIDTLVDLGHKVAIAEQIEDPKTAIGVVKREVVQVVTPGTAITGASPDGENNFLVSLTQEGTQFGLAYMDLATGQFFVTSLDDFTSVCGEVRNLRARELVVGYDLTEEDELVLVKQMNLLLSYEKETQTESPLIDSSLLAVEKAAAAILLSYVYRTQLRELSHLQKVSRYEIKEYLLMDYATKSSLDLLENARTGKKQGSLYWFLDETKTAMGLRLLRSWIHKPLIDRKRIETRQEVVQVLLDCFIERSDLIASLKGVYDIERLASRVSFGKIGPKDLLQLAQTLENVPAIQAVLEQMAHPALNRLIERLDPIPELYTLIGSAIDPDAQGIITEGNIIKTGFDSTLDQYRLVMKEGAGWIADIEAKERAQSGITNLKIDYNKKDGYYFHVTNSNIAHVPAHFFRKATLKNSERYGTEELAKIEGQMLEARDKSASLEYDIFVRLRSEVEKYIGRLQRLAQTIATIDVLQAFATVAEKQGLVRPQFTDDRLVEIENGRHAVVEKVMGAQSYIPNSVHLDEATSMQLITGPNMSGKSTYMRQMAVMVVLAQIGSYVPAERALLPIFDAIFTRIGAADDLVSGQSTFMVEMMEANKAIRLATEQSLILFDELGRGTATYDGMALAQAIIEHIHDTVGAKTFFATHYHELTVLEDSLSHLKNVHVATLEKNGQVTFLHKIENGPADKSYGIHVAKIAGMPDNLLFRAEQILTQLENQEAPSPASSSGASPVQLDLLQEESLILDELRAIQLYDMTPLQALNFLEQLKQKLDK